MAGGWFGWTGDGQQGHRGHGGGRQAQHAHLCLMPDFVQEGERGAALGAGVTRWLKDRPKQLADYKKSLEVQHQFYELVSVTKRELQAVYESSLAPVKMRAAREHVLSDMQRRYEMLKVNEWGGKAWYQSWFEDTPNNANFVGISTYQSRVPELKRLLTFCDDDLPKFYTILSNLKALNGKVAIPQNCQ